VDEIKNALVEQRVIELRGFGTFEVKVRKGRQNARNPRTGEVISVKAHGIASFRAGRELKQSVWNLLDQEGPRASSRKPAKQKRPNGSKK
jgi:integration host factor subunit beta